MSHLARALLLFLATSFAVQAGEEPLTLAMMEERVRPSVAGITAFRDGKEMAVGSGFFVRADGTLLTNLHLVAGAERLRVDLPSGESHDLVYYLAHDALRDLVVLRVPVESIPVLTLGDDRKTPERDAIWVVGHPATSGGAVAAGRKRDAYTDRGVAWVRVSATLSPNADGAPVLTRSGEVIGIAMLTVPDDELIVAAPARDASRLLSVSHPPRPFAEVASDLERDHYTGDPMRRTEHFVELRDALNEEFRVANNWATENGLRPVGQRLGVSLSEGEEHLQEYYLGAEGKDYGFIGVCDRNCSDIDLVLLTGTTELDADRSDDDRPMVSVKVARRGAFVLRLSMKSCAASSCTAIVQMYQAR